MTEPPPPPDRILSDRYELLAELGSGGMAVVYRARDRKLDRDVAVKIMRDDVSASLGAERFLKEIRLLTSLTHPNIVGLLDAGEDGGALYYVMPLIEGESLADRLERERSLPLEQAVGIVLDVARALSHAHAFGIIHRDIKPANIMLAGATALVADFGIAKAVGEAGSEKLTATGMAIGTVQYMSPEQAHGSAGVDQRTDQYALASVLYELLAGEPPFAGNNPQAILVRKSTEAASALRPLRETVSPALEEVVLRGLSRHPADRYVSVQEFAEALAAAPVRATPDQIAALSGSVTAVATPAKRPAAEWAASLRRRWRLVAALAVVAAGAVTALLALRPGGATAARSGEPVRIAFLPCTNADGSPASDHSVLSSTVGRLQRVQGVIPMTTSAAGRLVRAGLGPSAIADSLEAAFVATCTLADGQVDMALVGRDGDRTWRDRFPVAAVSGNGPALALLEAAGIAPTGDERAAMQAYQSSSRAADSLYRESQNYMYAMANDSMARRAVDLLNGAIAADSAFAPAWAMLSYSHMQRYRNLGHLYEPSLERRAAVRTAQVALRLNPRLPESHLALGFTQAWMDFDFAAARSSFDAALRLAPYNAIALHLRAFLAAWTGHVDTAVAYVDRALAAEPLDQLTVLTHGFIYYLVGRYAESIEDYRWVNQAAEDAHPADGLLVWSLIENGRLEEARAVAAPSCPPDATADACFAMAYVEAASGNRPWVAAWLRRLRREIASGVYAGEGRTTWRINDDFRAAELFAMSGQADSAFVYLEQAWLGGCAFLTRFRVDPHFKSLRADPRFENLATRIGLPPLSAAPAAGD